MSSSNCCFLTCILVSQEEGQVVWHSHLFQYFPQFIVIHTVKGVGVVNKVGIDVFLELSFFHDPADVGNLICGSSAFSKTRLNIWKFMVHVLLKPGLENFKHYFTSVWDERNCAVVPTFFGIATIPDRGRPVFGQGYTRSCAPLLEPPNKLSRSISFLWNWSENWPFPVLWPLLSFPNLLAYWVHHFHSIIF